MGLRSCPSPRGTKYSNERRARSTTSTPGSIASHTYILPRRIATPYGLTMPLPRSPGRRPSSTSMTPRRSRPMSRDPLMRVRNWIRAVSGGGGNSTTGRGATHSGAGGAQPVTGARNARAQATPLRATGDDHGDRPPPSRQPIRNVTVAPPRSLRVTGQAQRAGGVALDEQLRNSGAVVHVVARRALELVREQHRGLDGPGADPGRRRGVVQAAVARGERGVEGEGDRMIVRQVQIGR